MSKWTSRHGYSVSRCKASLSQKPGAPSSSFVRIEPKVQLVQHKASMLAGVSVTFNSATTISIKQGDADSIIRLVNLYERKNGESCSYLLCASGRNEPFGMVGGRSFLSVCICLAYGLDG